VAVIEAKVRLQATEPLSERLAPLAILVLCRAVDQIPIVARALDEGIEYPGDLRMHGDESIAGCGFVVHPHKLGAGVRINANVSRLKLRDTFDPSAGICSDLDGGGQCRVASFFRG
jgi:hypothetical protein